MEYRVIISGRLEFSNARSVRQAIKVIDHLQETRYKGEALFNDSSMLDEATCAFVVPRLVTNCNEKAWQNTVHFVEQVNEYAIAGDMNMWKIQDGHLCEHSYMEPDSEKTAVVAYKKGLESLKQGDEKAAIESFTKAIKKFGRHAKAYERRGFCYSLLGQEEKALEDFAVSLKIDPKRPEAYLSRAIVAMKKEDWASAIEDLNISMKRSIPHQSVNLHARQLKGDCLVGLGKYKEAVKEYNFVVNRKLTEDHPQSRYLRQIAFSMGKALAADQNLTAAIEAFDQALNTPSPDDQPELGEILLHRGLAFQQSGQSGFIEDWQQAADYGSEKAAELLAEVD